MKNTTITQSPAAAIKELHALIVQGVEAWTRAGKILVTLVDQDPDIYNEIIAKHPGLTKSTLAQLEAVGRNTLEPRLLLNGCIGYQRLRKCPLSDQRRALSTGIKIYEPTDDCSAPLRIGQPLYLFRLLVCIGLGGIGSGF